MRAFIIITSVITLLLPIVSPGTIFAGVEWEVSRTLSLTEKPIDLKTSTNGQWIFVLTAAGDILVYDKENRLNGKIHVGKNIDQMAVGPEEETLYLRNTKEKTVQTLSLTYIRDIDITGSPFKGTENAPVVIVDFSDFQCPYCAKLTTVFDQLLSLYPEKIKIVFKNYPLRSHRFAYKAATLAMAAHTKDMFWPVHDRMMENYNRINDEVISDIRKEFGLDTPEIDQLMNSNQIQMQVRKDAIDGQNAGVRGTPTIFINGRRLDDRRLEAFKAIIDRTLAELAASVE
ncbi:MAG: thioredoxin domain-containing protein [Desulfobacteraceae bacterium]|nr:thioredoxin domain-containing protein [Desulfobacteraceae bacterium]